LLRTIFKIKEAVRIFFFFFSKREEKRGKAKRAWKSSANRNGSLIIHEAVSRRCRSKRPTSRRESEHSEAIITAPRVDIWRTGRQSVLSKWRSRHKSVKVSSVKKALILCGIRIYL